MNVWKDFVEGMENWPDLEGGEDKPSIESLSKDESIKIEGTLLKVSFDVIMFFSPDSGKYYMMQSNQKLTDLGKCLLEDAIIKYNKYKKK